MSRKDDLDNHSNQLNPNNDAYYSSRGGRDDDDDNSGAGVARYWRAPEPRPVYHREHEVKFTLVTLNGQTCLGKMLLSDTGSRVDALEAKIEAKAVALHKQLFTEVKRLSGLPVVYSQLDVSRRTLEEHMAWEPTVPSGWGNQWARVDRKQWKRLARTRSYRQQAVDARQLIDQAAAQAVREFHRLIEEAQGSRVTHLAEAAKVFASIAKAPIFRVNTAWAKAVGRARAIDAADVVSAAVDSTDGFERALRAVHVLVRASNARAPESLRHPASFGYWMPESDAFTDYFGSKLCSGRMDELEVWFTKGERRLRAVLKALKSGNAARYDFGSYDVTMQPDLHISMAAAQRAMQPANRERRQAALG